MIISKIATYYGPLKEKFGVPRQSGLATGLKGRIVFEPEYRDANALRGLDGFERLWLLWGFSANRESWSPTVRPPRLGGNKAMGVFATRSPFRPNPIGLSAVCLDNIEFSADGPVLHVSGADLMDGTPIYDIKPYVAYADAFPGSRSGFVDDTAWEPLEVVIPEDVRAVLGDTTALEQVLKQDPRPQYRRSNSLASEENYFSGRDQKNQFSSSEKACAPETVASDKADTLQRTYGLIYDRWNVKFSVVDNVLTVLSVEPDKKKSI